MQKIADAVILQEEEDRKSESTDIFEITCDSVIFDCPKEDDIVIEVRPSSIKIEGNNTI